MMEPHIQPAIRVPGFRSLLQPERLLPSSPSPYLGLLDRSRYQPLPLGAPSPPKLQAEIDQEKLPETVHEPTRTVRAHTHLPEYTLYVYILHKDPCIYPELRLSHRIRFRIASSTPPDSNVGPYSQSASALRNFLGPLPAPLRGPSNLKLWTTRIFPYLPPPPPAISVIPVYAPRPPP